MRYSPLLPRLSLFVARVRCNGCTQNRLYDIVYKVATQQSFLAQTVGVASHNKEHEQVSHNRQYLSPRAQAAVMAEKAKEGFAPAAFDVCPGSYAWHVNEIAAPEGKRIAVPALKDEAALTSWLSQNARTVIAMPQASWEALAAKPENASVLLTQWLVHKPYVVVAVDAPAKAEPAPAVEEKPAAPAESASPAPAADTAPEQAPQVTEPQPEAPSAPAENKA